MSSKDDTTESVLRQYVDAVRNGWPHAVEMKQYKDLIYFLKVTKILFG